MEVTKWLKPSVMIGSDRRGPRTRDHSRSTAPSATRRATDLTSSSRTFVLSRCTLFFEGLALMHLRTPELSVKLGRVVIWRHDATHLIATTIPALLFPVMAARQNPGLRS